MTAHKNKFARRNATRRYNKRFLLAVEGRKTEPQYFRLFSSKGASVSIRVKRSSESAPQQVLRHMKEFLQAEGPLKTSDQAWLVVDHDGRGDEHLQPLHAWTKQRPKNHFLALSNPKFEYWLLLHFEDGSGIATARECDKRLKEKLPDYDKSIPAAEFTRERIKRAIQRAQALDTPPCTDWPRTPGSTVYRLVQNILDALQNP